jgi:flagellar hook-associated protein 3 FlgL
MRISSLSFFTASLASMQDNQSQIARLSQQISTGDRMLSAKDDPVAAAQALQLSDSIATRSQYLVNQQSATQTLNVESAILTSINQIMTDARAVLSQSNPSDSQSVRDHYSTTLANDYLQIKDLLNSRDNNGKYLFAGFNVTTQPYTHAQIYPNISTSAATTSPASTYSGTTDGAQPSTQGVRSITVDTGRQVQVSDNLQSVFQLPAGSPVSVPYFDTATNSVANSNTTDLLQAIDQIAAALHDPNMVGNQLQAGITNALNGISATLDRLSGIETRVANAQVQLADVAKTTKGLQTIEQNALSDLTLVDKTAAIIELQSRQTSLQAAQSAYASSSKLSLFNYL